jgi:hypothetical protein
MKHLHESFLDHRGLRGVHFYHKDKCNFLVWAEVCAFLKTLPDASKDAEFPERLLNSLANYDPDTEFLAVRQEGTTVSVELYSSEGVRSNYQGKSSF